MNNDQWREGLRKAFRNQDVPALDALLHAHASNASLYPLAPLECAIRFQSVWGVEQLLERGHHPSLRNLGTFFDECLASVRPRSVTVLDIWNAWLPWLEQQDDAFRGRALALFVDRARPCEVRSDGTMNVLFPLVRAITWESLSVSRWGQGCWEAVVSDVVTDTPEGETPPPALSPLQRAWLGDGHVLVEHLLKEGTSPHRVHPHSALPHWSLASLWGVLETASQEKWSEEEVRQARCQVLSENAFGEAFPAEPSAALLANFRSPERWKKVRNLLKHDALEQALPLPLRRPLPKPRF